MSWLDDHTEVPNVRSGAADLNSQTRGKRVPRRFAAKFDQEGTRLPLPLLNPDIRGEVIVGNPAVFENLIRTKQQEIHYFKKPAPQDQLDLELDTV